MTYTIRPATTSNRKPLIGLYGLSGSGKTMSALLIARGLSGPDGRVILIDTESGRGELYADVIPGGYDVLPLGEPFSPQVYREAMKAAFNAKPACVVVDSFSHEWEGVGGVLDMAAANEQRTKKPGLHCWKEPKSQHAKLMLSLLQSPCPVICCLRAKYKSRQTKHPKTGKTVIVKDSFATPIQSEEFIYEMMIHGEMLAKPDRNGELIGGYFRLTKASHPELRPLFSLDRQLSVETGERLAAWAGGGKTQRNGVATGSASPAAALGDGEASSAFPPGDAPPPVTVQLDKKTGEPDWIQFGQDVANVIYKTESVEDVDALKRVLDPALSNMERANKRWADALRERFDVRRAFHLQEPQKEGGG